MATNALSFATALLVSSLVLTVHRAHADEAPPPEAPPAEAPRPEAPRARFGARGQFMLDDLLGFRLVNVMAPTSGSGVSFTSSGIVNYSTSSGKIGASSAPAPGFASSSYEFQSTHIGVAPSFDYFVTDRISVGALAGVGYERSRTTAIDSTGQPVASVQDGYSLSLAPRVGYVLRITDDIALWPRVGLGYSVSRASATEGPEGRTLYTSYSAQADLGVVVRLARHAYLNMGPTLAYASTRTKTSSAVGDNEMESSGLGGGARVALGLVF